MSLATRLVMSFGLLTALSTAGLGLALRESRVREETVRFEREVKNACHRIALEVQHQAETDLRLIAGPCTKGELVDRTVAALEAGQLDEWRLALAQRVPALRATYGFDSLVLATKGEVLSAEPIGLLNVPPAEVRALVDVARDHYLGGTKSVSGLVARCRLERGGQMASLVGVRNIDPLLKRLAATADLEVVAGQAKAASRDLAVGSCNVEDLTGARFPITVTKSKAELATTLESIDRTVLYAALASAGAALLLGVLLGLSLSRPLADLAEEAGKVASDEAKPIAVRGSREVREVARAFNRMLRDLAATRRRLAGANRVAAWREVARRVAHEVKNPLAPIRAAVETLRRLRAREDPAFDEYFDEATRTVLDEVHRIANIVTEFTKFARLPPPKPQPEDVTELTQRVVGLQRAAAPDVKIDVKAAPGLPIVTCDADQVVQVLTNLVQNAVEAVKGLKSPTVTVELETEGNERVAVTVRDNGPGVAQELAPRLFEPYATTKPQGTGLGLAIAQRIAVEHGGELAYVGAAGQGAAFRFVLPVKGPELHEAGRGGPESEVQSSTPPP